MKWALDILDAFTTDEEWLVYADHLEECGDEEGPQIREKIRLKRQAEALAKSGEWKDRLPIWDRITKEPAARHILGEESRLKIYKTCVAHIPGDEVLPRASKPLVASWRAGTYKSKYRWFYIGGYALGGFGAYRLLRSDGKETSTGGIFNIDKDRRERIGVNNILAQMENLP